jgi:hypothetical protein
MKLVPSSPPGRGTRRARGFAVEMSELRAQGYTFESIRQALAAAGVHVSNATVQREVARIAQSRGIAAAPPPPPDAPESTPRSRSSLGQPIHRRYTQRQGDRRGVHEQSDHQPPGPCQAHPKGFEMKIAVTNFSGNVGKTTLARHLLLPRIGGARRRREPERRRGSGPGVTRPSVRGIARVPADR